MSIRYVNKAVQAVFNTTLKDMLAQDPLCLNDARGCYCLATSMLKLDKDASARDLRITPKEYDVYLRRYRAKARANREFAGMVRNVLDLSEGHVTPQEEMTIHRNKDAMWITVAGIEYKAMDVSTCFGKFFLGFKDGVQVKSKTTSLEDTLMELIHDDIICGIWKMSIKELKKALKL